ncbi:gamma-glutamylcyclotransferase family protein [Novosphingobium guangzhouense]|uniref:Gamma-glutamylcyclotransferase AIG2-like domain-containing protein n=1 Tax=Novosphingobium guangzhouense TaxID=1850347 RepID=A0A2K2FY59_9SPHN|nr:gamma-glutamylcyclotransferase family protein [Novosphingobium guangzhouense]PNU03700.1 hypothetical protein A8V01_22795 [Novosphingobium guangzhouense]
MKFFFYGTLRPDAATAMAHWIAERVTRAERGSVPGRLYALPDRHGWYPALMRGAGRVWGTVCHLRLRHGDLARLDSYEGPEYRRVTLPVRTDGGARTPAQVYVWRGACRGGHLIGADFLEWLRASRHKAYSSLAFRAPSH